MNLQRLQDLLGPEVHAVRAMPNTPASIGRGISVACANKRVTAVQRKTAGALLAAVGAVAWVDSEAQIDAVTAISGSGPAYVFYLVECLAAAGETLGLTPELAMTLARETVSGAGEMLHRQGEPASVLRANVTSPGGTTAAALDVLMGPRATGHANSVNSSPCIFFAPLAKAGTNAYSSSPQRKGPMAGKSDPEEKIIKAALRLAAKQGWTGLALADIAKSARVSLPALSKHFSSKTRILAAYGRRIDAEVLQAAADETLSGEAARDRLFDVLMLRFDALAPEKAALKRIAADLRRDPLAAAPLARPMLQSMNWMLEAAGIDSSGIAGALRVRGLALVWASAFRVWLDDGEDQSKTMAELDKRLRQGEEFLAGISRFNARRRSTFQKDAAQA